MTIKMYRAKIVLEGCKSLSSFFGHALAEAIRRFDPNADEPRLVYFCFFLFFPLFSTALIIRIFRSSPCFFYCVENAIFPVVPVTVHFSSYFRTSSRPVPSSQKEIIMAHRQPLVVYYKDFLTHKNIWAFSGLRIYFTFREQRPF